MTKMEILLKITPAVLIVRKLTLKMEEKRQNRGSLLDVASVIAGRKPESQKANFVLHLYSFVMLSLYCEIIFKISIKNVPNSMLQF